MTVPPLEREPADRDPELVLAQAQAPFVRAWIAQREAPFPGSPLRVVVRAGEETRLEIPAH